MPITTVAVSCLASRPDGSLIAGGKFRFLLSNTDTENGLVVPREISAIANASGVATANLWPNSLGALGTQYRVLLTDPLGSTIDLGSCTVPTSACNLHAILGLGTAPTLDQATVAKLAAQTAAAASSTSATQSASSATQAAASATAAAGSATAAAASQTAATGSVTSAATSATAAGNSATSAASSNTAAGASAISAALSAADALSSKNAAATSATNSASSATSAQTSATNAATSASTATTKASEAATSATNAATSEAAALASKNAAATSETNAQGSATTAATQASNAASSATNAASSAANAASSATAAASSAAAVAAVTTGNMSSQNANSVAITGGAISGTSITVADNVFTLQDNIDPTKQAQFQLSGLATGTTFTYTLPAISSTLAALGQTQTFTAGNTFSANTNTFGSSTGTGTQGLGSGATTTGNTKTVNIGTGGLSGSTTNITVGSANGSTTTILGSTVIGGASGNQSLQVNNVASAVNYTQIVGAVTGQYAALTTQGADANVGLLVNTKGTYPVTINSALEINPTASSVNFISFYGAVTGGAPVFVAKGSDANVAMGFATKGTQGFAFYTNNFGAQQAAITHTASAVNYLNLTGAATGAAPTISAQGSDANIGLVLSSKGTGVVALGGSTVANSGFSVTTPTGTVDRVNMYSSAGGNPYFEATGTSATINLAFYSKGLGQVLFGRNGGAQNFLIGSAASSVNFLQVVAAATTGAPELSAQGSDANINLKLTPKGTGTVQFGTYTAGALSPTGYITITDAGGTSRRLLVG